MCVSTRHHAFYPNVTVCEKKNLSEDTWTSDAAEAKHKDKRVTEVTGRRRRAVRKWKWSGAERRVRKPFLPMSFPSGNLCSDKQHLWRWADPGTWGWEDWGHHYRDRNLVLHLPHSRLSALVAIEHNSAADRWQQPVSRASELHTKSLNRVWVESLEKSENNYFFRFR